MKYDLSAKPTIGATRTLDALHRAMISLLTEKPFEEITVQELCEDSMLPRATFYNYFEDKYDLLTYCWMMIHRKTDPGLERRCDYRERLFLFMDNAIDFFEERINTVNKILRYNSPNQYLINNIRTYLTSEIVKIVCEFPQTDDFRIPWEMAAKLCSNAVLIVLEWKFVDKKSCTKAQAHEFLELLVNRDASRATPQRIPCERI